MGFFNFINKQNNVAVEQPTQSVPITTGIVDVIKSKMHQAFSTPWLKIGKGNLGAPYVAPYYTISGIVQFGSDNLYPQLLDQMYYTSAIHSDCINFIVNASVGGGYEYKTPLTDGKQKVDLYTFEKRNKWSKLIKNLTSDFVIHKRVYMLIYKDEKGNFKSMKRIHPAYMRNSIDCQTFVYCNDWSRRSGLVTYNRYHPTCKDLVSVFYYGAETVGQDIYPLPSYISIMNDAFLDGEISLLQKSNIQNSIWPSIGVRVPRQFETEAEVEIFKAGLTSKQGAENAGKVMVVSGSGFDNTPEIVSMAANNNDQLFDSTIESILNKICFAHGINPSIMGIKIAGSLGNSEELQMSYSIFEKNIIKPLRSELTEIFNDLLIIAGINNTLVIKDYQIIDTVITSETNLDGANPINGAENANPDKSLSGTQITSLLEILNSVSAGQIPRETGISVITSAFGLSKETAEEILGTIGAGFVPTPIVK